MNYTIACTYCQKEYPVDDRMAGKRVKCKNCGEVFIVPQPGTANQGGDDAIDLSAYTEVESPTTVYTPPPIAPSRPTAAAPAYAPPPVYPPPLPQKRSWSSGFSGYGGQRAWWSAPVVIIIIVLRILAVNHLFNFGSKSGGWNTNSAASMTVDQKRNQTAANLARLGPELKKQAPSEPTFGFSSPTTVHFNYLPHSLFVSPFDPTPPDSGASDYKFIHLQAFTSANASHAIVLYDQAEMNASDGTTVYRADGSVEHLSKEDFDRQNAADALALNENSNPFSRFHQPNMTPNLPMFNQPPVTPPPPPSAVDAAELERKRSATSMTMQRLYQVIHAYQAAHDNATPPGGDFQSADGEMFRVGDLHSPFDSFGGRNDYLYTHYGKMASPPSSIIIAHDEAENNRDTETTVLHADGRVERIPNSRVSAALLQSDLDANAASQNYQQSHPAPAVADNPAEPVIPAHAWTAEPDPPAAPAKIDPHFKMVFQGTDEFYFPPQPSIYMFLHRGQGMGIAGRAPVDELWNLKAGAKVSSIPVIRQMDDAMLSPDGKYFVGRTMGGAGQATVFEVWSPHTGKLLQTLSEPPVTGGETPIAVGFLEDDQLLTIGDRFDVWDLKAGTHLRQFGDPSAFGADPFAALSASGKLTALVTSDHQTIMLFDTATGKALGQSPIPDKQARQFEFDKETRALSFSPDGQQLAVLLNGAHLYDWHVADGSLAGQFKLVPPVDRHNFQKADGNGDTIAWMPDSEGWLAGGDRVIDRVTGTAIYQMPNFTEQSARECGDRQVIDGSHVLLGFRADFAEKTALETLSFNPDEITKTRASIRAAAAPATQPATQPQ